MLKNILGDKFTSIAGFLAAVFGALSIGELRLPATKQEIFPFVVALIMLIARDPKAGK